MDRTWRGATDITKQERALRTRRALIEHAAGVFALKGFAATNLADISSSAGMTKGALYFHFASKEALAQEVCAEARRRLAGAASTAHARSRSDLQTLVDLTHALAVRLRADAVIRAGVRLSSEQTGMSRHGTGDDLGLRWSNEVHRRLTQAHQNKELRSKLTAGQAAALVVAATVGLASLAVSDPEWLGSETVADVWSLALAGLVPTERLHLYDPFGTSDADASACCAGESADGADPAA